MPLSECPVVPDGHIVGSLTSRPHPPAEKTARALRAEAWVKASDEATRAMTERMLTVVKEYGAKMDQLGPCRGSLGHLKGQLGDVVPTLSVEIPVEIGEEI